MNNLHVKTGDNVQIISGKDKGKQGKVLEVSIKEQKVIVEGRNLATKHVKPRRQGEAGGILEVEGAIYASKVQLVCSNAKCEKNGKATRAKYNIVDGKKIRVCAKCGETL